MTAASHEPDSEGHVNEDLHRLIIEPVEIWAERAASMTAATITQTIQARGRCVVAVSTGHPSLRVLRELAHHELAWDAVCMLATERLVERRPTSDAGDAAQEPDELVAIFADLPVSWLTLPATAASVADFTSQLAAIADQPPAIDLAVLQLGSDGHTAKLLAGDPAMREVLAPAAMTEADTDGRCWMTLTRPVFDRARAVLWLVAGAERAPALGRLLAGDLTMPAGLIRPRQSVVVADSDAARQA